MILKYLTKWFKTDTIRDKSKHRVYTTKYEDLCQ